MTKPMHDALIEEIVRACAETENFDTDGSIARSGRYDGTDAIPEILFSPCSLGGLSLCNRCVIAPLEQFGGQFVLNDEVRRFYLARCDAGLLTTAPVPAGSGGYPFPFLLWRRLIDQLHAHGSRLFLQIRLDGSSPQETADLAAAAQPGGFDGICLYARDNDSRLLETVSAIRARLGRNWPILCRVSLSPAVYESGVKVRSLKSVRPLAEEFELLTNLAKAGVDAFEIGLGSPETPWLMRPASQLPAGCFAEAARAVKAHFRCRGICAQVLAFGKLGYPNAAESLLEKGDCDLISLDGSGISDPAWCQKARAGQSDEIVPLSLPSYSVSKGNEKIAVIGAGCRGLSYAIRAADAGHRVELFEAAEKPGGDLALFRSAASYEKRNLLLYLLRQIERRHTICLHAGTRADAEWLKRGRFDRIVFAFPDTGYVPPNIPGWGEIPYITPDRMPDDPPKNWKRKHVLIIGKDAVACDLAWDLLSRGLAGKVTLLTEGAELMTEEEPFNRAWFLHHFIQRGGVIMTASSLQRIRRHSVVVKRSNSSMEINLRCDVLILAERKAVPHRLPEEAERGHLAERIEFLPEPIGG